MRKEKMFSLLLVLLIDKYYQVQIIILKLEYSGIIFSQVKDSNAFWIYCLKYKNKLYSNYFSETIMIDWVGKDEFY